MSIVKKIIQLCPFCMESHEMDVVKEHERTTFKNKPVDYEATYLFCANSGEYICTEDMLDANDIAMKDAYRKSENLLTSDEIVAIRRKYGISQSDLCTVLGWGAKTITRYESHQVQDIAHDSILKRLDTDPEWFLEFLKTSQNKLDPSVYKRYYDTASLLFRKTKDLYLRKTIQAQYAGFNASEEKCGGAALNLDKISDAIRYFANAVGMQFLYKVKLMKLLWYADNLSFKRYNHSMTGLAYASFPMGALPIGSEFIVELKGINYEVESHKYQAIHFLPTENKDYNYLSPEDIEVLDKVIAEFSGYTATKIVDRMHAERAYTETPEHDIIPYQYAKYLSIS